MRLTTPPGRIPALLTRLCPWGLCLLGVLLAGCATPPPADDPDAVADYQEANDPLEPTNRVFYAINDGVDSVVLRPLALAYSWAVPEVVRTHTHNVLDNLGTPVVLANDTLQAKPHRMGDTSMRMLINTTVGVAGVFDVATGWGYPEHDSDAGMTMALWGVPEGPFLYLPVLGPTNPRDATGFGADVAMDPFTWVGNGEVVEALLWTRYSLTALDTRSGLLDTLDKVKAQALDPYATFRSLYRQHRHSQIDQARAAD